MKIGLYCAVVEQREAEWSVGPPLGLGYLCAYLKAYGSGYEVVICRRLDDLIAEKPDLVGISSGTYSFDFATRAAKRVKEELGVPTIAGGTHITALPERLPKEFDLAVMGEGEETFLQLCDLYKAERRFEPGKLQDIDGIVFHGGDETVIRPPRAFIEPLDRIPHPDRKAIGDQWGEVKRHAHVMTSRGCLFRCTFCSSVRHWGRTYRLFSPEYVVEEMEELVRDYGAEHVIIFDDLFVDRKNRVDRISRLLGDRGLLGHVEFTVSARSNLIREPVAEALAAMNVRKLTIGFESASPQVLKYLAKEAVTPEQIHQTMDLCRKYGLKIDPSFIIGSPCETREDLMATFDLVVDNMDLFTSVVIGPLVVLPGTPIWDYAVSRNLIDMESLAGVVLQPEDFEDERRFFFEKYVYLNEHMPKEEFFSYYQIAKKLERLVTQQSQLRCRLEESVSDEALSFIPWNRLASVLASKIKRRLVHGKVSPGTGPGDI